MALLADQNFDGRILRGLPGRISNLDVVRAVDAGLATVSDPDLLAWAAGAGRILLTHDVNTVTGFAYDRVRAGLAMPGVFLVSKSMPIGQAIDELELALFAKTPDECKDQVTYFPL